jgi:hypothetical protein
VDGAYEVNLDVILNCIYLRVVKPRKVIELFSGSERVNSNGSLG